MGHTPRVDHEAGDQIGTAGYGCNPDGIPMCRRPPGAFEVPRLRPVWTVPPEARRNRHVGVQQTRSRLPTQRPRLLSTSTPLGGPPAPPGQTPHRSVLACSSAALPLLAFTRRRVDPVLHQPCTAGCWWGVQCLDRCRSQFSKDWKTGSRTPLYPATAARSVDRCHGLVLSVGSGGEDFLCTRMCSAPTAPRGLSMFLPLSCVAPTNAKGDHGSANAR